MVQSLADEEQAGMTKYIFLTGGVVSSVGKGVAAAAIGRILKALGISVTLQKLDPYLNVDPGTMSPYQHGATNFTSWQVYNAVIAHEPPGTSLGARIQMIPHIPDEIKQRIIQLGR